ncbi:hypothetical protein Ddye_005611 [Dipteronia dyeriana]|uniref:Uncharacterized protein n=1 Tax=Dipteronia dyeriana TaxID=168575 RepID=A0AAD9XHG0_9ROSI|nr:hypothetical protein Ddye_005611 [Dipteronia dyeriana]
MMDAVLEGIQPSLLESMRNFWNESFIEEDVRQDVFDIGPMKVLVIDGLPALFYQKYWVTVGSSVTTACVKCLTEGVAMDAMNDNTEDGFFGGLGKSDYEACNFCYILIYSKWRTLWELDFYDRAPTRKSIISILVSVICGWVIKLDFENL